jgi:UDP:flavonoid glycosyltransferase YjiC (YdhE family)
LSAFQGAARPIASIQPSQFRKALRRGSPLYSAATLETYVQDDLALIERESPDLIVGDFRLSLSVSARVAQIPYATIANAYWSPDYQPPSWPVPQLSFTKLLPISLAQAVFGMARPLAFRQHTRPLNTVRRRFGLESLGTDLRRVYTDADFVLYADLPELFPISTPPHASRFLGPVLWEPSVSLPEWWDSGLTSEQAVYVTLGSSGDASLLPTVVQAVSNLGKSVLIATAGAQLASPLPPNVHVAEYLPGLQTARRASVVICNGGSLTSYQALAAGTPVVGIASNLDQFLNMQAIERAGAGRAVRGDRLQPSRLQKTVAAVLDSTDLREAASRTARFCQAHSFAEGCEGFLDSIARSSGSGTTS